MNIGAKVLKYGFDAFTSIATHCNKSKAGKTLLSFGKAIEKDTAQAVRLRVSPDITMPIRPATLKASKPSFAINSRTLAENPLAEGELGNMAIRINEQATKDEPAFRAMLEDMFPGLKIETRAKAPSSDYSKLKKVITKKGKTVASDTDGLKIVTDSIGGRVAPADLTRKDVIRALRDMEIDGKPLSRKEKRFVLRALNGDKSLTPSQQKVANRLMRPVLLKLAEKQSEPVFNSIMLGMMKDALNRNITSIDKLAKEGISPQLLEQLQKDVNIKPIKVIRFNNYRGPDGIPIFSDRQIREIEKMQLATGEKFSITTCASDKDLVKYGNAGLTESESSAIKDYGYTRAQMNIELPDGRITELQVGTGDFYRLEHDAIYNCMQEKNTINDIFKPYQAKLRSLDDKAASRYQRYSQQCHNDDRISQLGGKFKLRRIPKGLPKSLSRQNMEILCDTDEALQKLKLKDFEPHLEINYVA